MEFAESMGTDSIAALRAKPTDEMLQASLKRIHIVSRPISTAISCRRPRGDLRERKTGRVPLLAGWNADEGSYHRFSEKDPPTPENFADAHSRAVWRTRPMRS